MKVSIIIPAYNVEKYLDRCLKSIQEQTFRDLEVILVDDGSTDRSGEICDRFAGENQCAKVIHQKNQGQSAARNAGIEAATGDAFFFLDSDDYISRDCIQKCAELLCTKNADVAVIKMVNVSESMNKEIMVNTSNSEIILSPEQAIEASLYQWYFDGSVGGKLYKRAVIGDIRFPAGCLSEDLATFHLFMSNAKIIVWINQIGYYYRQRDNSTMHVFNPKRMMAIKWAKDIEAFCEDQHPAILPAAVNRTFNIAIHLLLDLPEDDAVRKEYSPILWDEVKRTRMQVLLDRKSRGREKAAAILAFFGGRVLKAVWNSRFAVKNKVHE